MSLLIFYLALAIGVSFFCSIAEAILLSIRPSYIAAMPQESRTAKRLKKLRDNLGRPLAAILTANTIAHTVGAAGVGAQAASVFGNQYIGMTSAILTLLILVFSEIIPKTLGASYWQRLAPVFGTLIHWLTVALFPLVWCSEKLTRMLSPSGKNELTFSREEMEALVEIGKQEGILDLNEHSIVSNVMKLNKLSVRSIMTPRPVIFSVSEDMTIQEFFEAHGDTPFSRIPIYGKTQNDIKSYVLKTDLLIAQARDQFEKRLSEFRREFLILSDTLSASDIYNRLIREKSHLSLIVDEFGTVQGLVTLEDVMESLIGLEILDELDKVKNMQSLAQKRWRERTEAMGIDLDVPGISK